MDDLNPVQKAIPDKSKSSKKLLLFYAFLFLIVLPILIPVYHFLYYNLGLREAYYRILIMFPPGANATQAEKLSHFAIVSRFAERADELDLTSCKPSPFVLEVDNNKTLKVINRDEAVHTIVFDSEIFEVAGNNAEQEVKINFAQDGVYSYSCDGSEKPAGYLRVVSLPGSQ